MSYRLLALPTLLVACFGATVLPQAPLRIEFEVASIKPTNTLPGRDSYGGGYCRGTNTRGSLIESAPTQ